MIIKNKKYAKILYPLGAIAIIWWAVTSVLKELAAQTIKENIVPLSVQLLFCLLILILMVIESVKLWSLKGSKDEAD